VLLATRKAHQFCLPTACRPVVADSLLWDQEVHRCTTTVLAVTQVTTLVVCSIRCDEVVLVPHPTFPFVLRDPTYMEGINTL
jgi:hypothetical protein